MLKKILNIKNIGLFNNASYTSSSFDKATLIYANNGRGKSTLASILRSCAMSDATSINIRRALEGSDTPEVKLLFDNGTTHKQAIFSGNTWTSFYTNILVFDTEFIDKNVYSGTIVDSSHRQGLLKFALGEDAVQLNQTVQSETQKAYEKGKEVTNLEKSLAGYRDGMPLQKFANLQLDPDIDNKINSCQKRLTDAKNKESFQKKESPQQLNLPDLNIDDFFETLATTLETLENSAEQAIQSHIDLHSREGFEKWLSQGQSFENGSNCPYCGQDITDNLLLTSYKTYFNESYQDLRSKVSKLDQTIENIFSDSIVHKLYSIVEKNKLITEQWMDHINLSKIDLEKDKLLAILKQTREVLYDLATSKQQNLLEKIGSQQNRETVENLCSQLNSIINDYNELIDQSVTKIENFKQNLAIKNVQDIEEELQNLNFIKIRQKEEVCTLIQEWNKAKEAKQLHERNKRNARTELDTLMTQTLQQYQAKINSLVQKFGASFEIDALSHDYRGSGVPRSNYGLKVKGQDVKLSADDSPSFSTALSEGDKRTLAFAFFIARIESDPNLEDKVVVIDDPVCSLDRNRRYQTKRILRDIGMKSEQLIVLGHDPYFLRDLRDDLQNKQVEISTQVLKITRVQNDYSDFDTCDIDNKCASGYYQNHKILQDFMEGNTNRDLITVARSIRPLLEGYLHRRFPCHVQRNKLFGRIIGDAKKAQLPNPLVYLQSLTTELYEINDYAGQFHHDTNPAADTVCINEGELRSYVERALAIIHKGKPLNAPEFQ